MAGDKQVAPPTKDSIHRILVLLTISDDHWGCESICFMDKENRLYHNLLSFIYFMEIVNLKSFVCLLCVCLYKITCVSVCSCELRQVCICHNDNVEFKGHSLALVSTFHWAISPVTMLTFQRHCLFSYKPLLPNGRNFSDLKSLRSSICLLL